MCRSNSAGLAWAGLMFLSSKSLYISVNFPGGISALTLFKAKDFPLMGSWIFTIVSGGYPGMRHCPAKEKELIKAIQGSQFKDNSLYAIHDSGRMHSKPCRHKEKTTGPLMGIIVVIESESNVATRSVYSSCQRFYNQRLFKREAKRR